MYTLNYLFSYKEIYLVLVIMDVHCTESIPQSYFFSYVQRKLGFLNKNVYMSDVQCTYRASRDTTMYMYDVRRTTTQTYIQYTRTYLGC